MIRLCLLAAGSGKRFGSNKLLADLGGQPLWSYGYRVLRQVRQETGAALRVISRHEAILDAVGQDGVFCPDSEAGLSHTVRCGCLACGSVAPADKLLFLAADQPRITAASLRKLLSVPLAEDFTDPLPVAACAFDGQNTGNPVVFSGLLYPELLALTGDRGGKAVLCAYPDRIETVLCPAEELTDVDFPADLRALTPPN